VVRPYSTWESLASLVDQVMVASVWVILEELTLDIVGDEVSATGDVVWREVVLESGDTLGASSLVLRAKE